MSLSLIDTAVNSSMRERTTSKAGSFSQEWERMKGKCERGIGAGETVATDLGQSVTPHNVPFACVICKESYRSAIVIRCGHFFCKPCALQRYRKDPSCAVCAADTGGVFKSARRLLRR